MPLKEKRPMELETQPASEPSSRRRMVIMGASVALFMGLLVAFNTFKSVMIRRALAATPELAQTVTVAEIQLSEWQPALSAVGTVRARQGADLAFEVAGVVNAIDVTPGSEVKQGQPLVTLNDAAEASQLRQLQASSALAELTLKRARQQFEAKTMSPADFDAASADAVAKQAAVSAQQAILARKHLLAPFAGKVGIIATSPGAYLNAGTSVLTLQQLDRVYVDFALPQKNLGQIRKGQKALVALDAYPGRAFTGEITAVNPKVDGATRNVQLEASFGNGERLLVPGMFASLSLEVGAKDKYLTLPQTAVTYNPYGTIVFLAVPNPAKGGFMAQQVFITTGATRGDQVAVLTGLKPGAQVVTSGSIKLRNGTPLLIDNRVQPKNDPNPRPQER
jgi:membrane fusion protein (multidrug efflux system)